MGLKTRPPGPHSFTTYLIQQLRASLNSTGSAKILDIANTLAHRDSGCRETPVHFSGLGDGRSTIRLEPYDTNPISDTPQNREVAWLTLRVSLRDMLSHTLIDEMIQWLKARLPRKVSRLTVEHVVQSANHVAHFIHDGGRGRTSGPKFGQLSPSAKHEIIAAWDDFRSLIAALATQIRSRYTVERLDVDVQDIDSTRAEAMLIGPLTILSELENRLLALQSVLQRSVMALPDLYGKRESLLEAIDDAAMQDLGFVPLLKWRLDARFPSDTDRSMETDHSTMGVPDQPKVFQSLIKEELQEHGTVLVEYKTYDKCTTPVSEMKRMEQNVQTLADILKTQGPPGFHSLRCTSWFHEKQNTRLGLMFEYPRRYDNFKSLRELLQMPASSQRPTLAQRFSIAKNIGEALLKWHISANWVHQGIASHNIYFFKPKNSARYEYSCPYLCGFEFARPSDGISVSTTVENFEHNVYRHPDRQGEPSKHHTKQHDFYAYGILLLEIGMWNLVSDCFDAKSRSNLQPFEMQQRIKANARKRLGHTMGTAYEQAASRCLNEDFGVELDNYVGTKLAKAFQDLVLEKIQLGTRLD